MRARLASAIVCGVLLVAGSDVASGRQSAPAASEQQVQPQALIKQCNRTGCHSERGKAGGLVLESLDFSDVPRNAALWEKVVRKLRAGVMPPTGLPRPSQAAQDQFIGWLEDAIDRAAAARPNPGRAQALHRLNRTEYRNVVRDLLEVNVDVASLLPADNASFGFDNISGVLTISPSLMERYLVTARKIGQAAVFGGESGLASQTYHVPQDRLQADRMEGLPFGTRGGLSVEHTFPQDAEYQIRIELMGAMLGGEELDLRIDGVRAATFTLKASEVGLDLEATGDKLDARRDIRSGPHTVAVAFRKTPSVPADAVRVPFLNPTVSRPPVPYVKSVTITGPFGATGPGDTPSRRRVFTCRPKGSAQEQLCARQIMERLARRGYRRPVTPDDLRTLMAAYEQGRVGATFDEGVERAVEQLLVSPAFLFRVLEQPSTVAGGTSHYRLSDLELASRLSFFLWSSIPDDELLDVASRGLLSRPGALEQQVRRMLADSRSEALTANFAGQWLQLRNLDALRPSEVLFPDFDDSLRKAFRRETELFFDSIIREDRSALDLLRANYTFLNERLATHYEVPYVKGSHFRRVTVTDETRRGLLGQGSILMVTSHATRTSPVLRGKWVLENILGTRAPDPPANVPPLPEEGGAYAGRTRLSMREQMARHRSNAVCAACHAMIDPAGFALEGFDAVGRRRDVDESFKPIDASGTLPDGTKFSGVAELRTALLRRPNRFVYNLTEKLLTYALGRGVDYYDMPAVRRIVREAATSDYKLSAIINGIVRSAPFQMQAVDSSPKEPASTIAAR